MYAALVLAAGGSTRMGGDVPKLLLPFRGKSLLRRAVDVALEVPAEQVIVVLGAYADRLLPELDGTGVSVVINDQWQEGLSTSLRGGLAAVSSEARGVFIYPADMPFLTSDMLRELAQRQQASGRPGTMTEVNGVRGVPVFVTRTLFPSLMIQDGDVGGAAYLRAHPDAVDVVHFDDPELVRDVDLAEDYEALREIEEGDAA